MDAKCVCNATTSSQNGNVEGIFSVGLQYYDTLAVNLG